ncbi:ABC transporter substrate-binding protein [Corynebacterium felinum]|uniref:Peptide/nickel transport system substrate-binding protein n=1 Tax=Corynebacterium felinum TaxID=131318 RepID=A0ABU2B9Y9_9CORY|nr:ABC transporter substrate-binding protein [Corynebacterium felinum]MDF5821552.1 ABC transporter substrate-binding protein [Corynebacterium felinum]MDR7355091.1 peptide/nickel transport system substrate-binding protein [Corynebacterium felinum]WJY94441.1 Glutathione-binding protein GsiB precursor [Corynebacterium felinum]
MTNTAEGMNRRGFLKMAGVFAAAAGISATVSACGSKDESAPAGGTAAKDSAGSGATEITAGISYELGTNGYDPMTTTSALTVAANWHTLEGLYEIKPTPDRTVYAALAAGEPTVDGTNVEVKLRDGAVFHNGEKVTAEDVVFSFERVLNPDNKSLYASFIPFIEKVEAKDETTVAFTLNHPFSLIKERLAVVKIVPKAAVEADAKAFDANPVGTGPWKMIDNGAATSTVIFDKFADYNGPVPAKAEKMIWKILPDAATRTNAIESKSVLAIDSVPYLSIDQVKGSANVESVQGFGLLFAMFNNGENSSMKELKNRQGILYSIDMDKVIKTGMSNQASPATCFVQENHEAYKKASTVYALDAAKAAEYFAETGLKEIKMLVTDHDWVRPCTAIIKESVEAAGVKVNFTEMKSSDLYTQIAEDNSWDVVIAPGDPSVFGADADLLLRWWYAGDTWTDGRMHWKGTDSYNKVQELLGKASEAEGKDQEALWHEIFDLISDEVPLYPLFHRKSPSAWNADALDGFEPISLTGLSFVDVGLK